MEQGVRNERKTDNAYTSDLAVSIGRSDCVDPTTCDRYNRKPARDDCYHSAIMLTVPTRALSRCHES
jgi:hypothetical protein